MNDATAEQFLPGMPEPLVIPESVRDVDQAFKRWQEDSQREGGLMTKAVAATALGVSHARVCNLCEEGRLEVYEHFDRQWISTNDVNRYRSSERKPGRPMKLRDVLQAA
jgi:hypothetical protein